MRRPDVGRHIMSLLCIERPDADLPRGRWAMCGLVCLANVFDTESPWKQTEHLFTSSLFGSFERVWEVRSLSAGETCWLCLAAAITCDQGD